MRSSHGLVFIKTIEPTLENATAIQALTLQDVKAAGFPNALELADPSHPDMVEEQRNKLRDHPERYSGYTLDGKLVAYIKQNHWIIDDELPFASFFRAILLRVIKLLRRSTSTGQWGIFGLVVAEELSAQDRTSVLLGLLQRSCVDARGDERRVVNVVIHNNDLLLGVARWLAFAPVGKPGEAAGAPGLKQQRYQRHQRPALT